MNSTKPKLIRITTVPVSLKLLLKGQLRFMSENGFEVIGVSSSGSELEEVEESEGIRVRAIEMSRQITPFRDLKSLFELYRFLKKEKPQIVHSHTPKAGIVGMLAAKLVGVPIRLHTVAGLPLMEAGGAKRKVLDFVEKLTYSCATKVYPNSKGLYDFILENKFCAATKLQVMGQGSSNGIDTAYFSSEQVSENKKTKLKQELNLRADDFVFVFVGRMVGDKGINELVNAFQSLTNNDLEIFHSSENKQGNLKLLLVGPLETELDPLFAETLNEIENNPNIILVGFQSDVRPYFGISDCLVFPSYREGFPNVVMQAGAMGLPAIVTDINGCNEIIIDGENGKIIEVRNTVALHKAMLEMRNNKMEYNRMKSVARKLICDRYEQSVVWSELLKEYKKLISENEIH